MILASLVLTFSASVLVVTIAQVVLALLVVAASIHVTRLLHDAVPSTIRSGVASGVGAVSWMAFLPFALVFGLVSKHIGVHTAGWMITAVTVLAGALLAKVALGHRPDEVDDDPAAPEPVPAVPGACVSGVAAVAA
jgi:MFS family permease